MTHQSFPRSRSMEISGWGNVPRQPAQVYRPEKIPDVAATVRHAPAGPLVARGLGRSYGDAALNDGGGVILDTQLSRFLGFEPMTGTLVCEAGASLEEIIDTFLPMGFFPPVTPGTKFVTVGGAIAADVHGKNHHRDGSFAEFLDSFELLIASGETLHCSRKENPDAFWATIGGMGLTGVIVEAKFRLRRVETGYIAVDYQKAENLDEALAAFAAGDEHYQYSVAWIDCLASGQSLGRSVLIRGNHAGVEQLRADKQLTALSPPKKSKKSVKFNFPGFALSPFSVRVFNELFYERHQHGRQYVDYDEFFYPLDSVLNWNRIYGRRGFFQYQAVFPTTDNSRCLRELLQTLSNASRASFLAVLKTMGKGSGGMLSFPMQGQTLALDLPNSGIETVPFLQELDKIVLRHGGRVYLAKDATTTRESFRTMYPELARFNAVKAKLDPNNRFSSSQSRRLGIGEGV